MKYTYTYLEEILKTKFGWTQFPLVIKE